MQNEEKTAPRRELWKEAIYTKPIIYATLAMEMMKTGTTYKAVAEELGISIRSLYSKMRGESGFSWDETCIIQNTFFPNIPKEVLFHTDVS